MSVYRALAPAKINLGLFLGPRRDHDGRHELASVMQSISLADELTLEPAPAAAEQDEVLCPGVPGDPQANLAAAALRAFRARTGWRAPPQRLSILKRIPVAAGLGGGSADAAATLRLASQASGLGDHALLIELAERLGADVPAQVLPGRWLATGAGERLRALPAPAGELAVLVLALEAELSTAAVFAEADRLGSEREPAAVERLGERLAGALADGRPLPAQAELLGNDLQAAAVSLCPAVAAALAEIRRAGAGLALLSGSGPTVLGFCAEPAGSASNAAGALAEVAGRLSARRPAPVLATAVSEEFGRPVAVA